MEWKFRDRNFRLVDTAGLSRVRTDQRLLSREADRKFQTKVDSQGLSSTSRPSNRNRISRVKLPGTENLNPEEDPSQFSTNISEMALISALNALKFAQVVLLVVEGSQGKFSKVDLQLAHKCLEEGRGLVIAANKRDIVKKTSQLTPEQYEEGVTVHCDAFLKEFGNIPVVSCCGTGPDKGGLDRLLKTVINTHDAWSKRISTWVLNKWLKDTLIVHQPPRISGKALSLKYITQVKNRPPAFALFCNAHSLPGFFERFLRNKLQSDFKLEGIPVRFTVKKTRGNVVNRKLLKQGKHTRRGVAKGEGRSVRSEARRSYSGIMKSKLRDDRRRRDSRLRKTRRPGKHSGNY